MASIWLDDDIAEVAAKQPGVRAELELKATRIGQRAEAELAAVRAKSRYSRGLSYITRETGILDEYVVLNDPDPNGGDGPGAGAIERKLSLLWGAAKKELI